ncbi:MAG TPA: aromatic amino acid ammonia-lyase [Gaiellales bacterium]|nr:aromatic amino acid ammonia-lyase [Gaiellales bacterium]
MQTALELDDHLRIEDVVEVARGRRRVTLAEPAAGRIRRGREVTEALLHRGERVYGLTTGVGALKRVSVGEAEQEEFNRLLVLSHRTGTGPAVDEDVVRAAMLAQAAGFARGRGGVRVELVQLLLDALNAGFAPRVRTTGSLGQSDLGPLADIGSALAGDDLHAAALREAGLEPWRPADKEALAFVNSNAFTLGWTALALGDVAALLDRFDESAALTFEGMLGNVEALDPAVADARPVPGVAEAINRMRSLLAGGRLIEGGMHRHLQDPLTMRVVPQTHSAARVALEHSSAIVEAELVSSHDNPSIAPDGRALSNGNFDSVPYGVTVDYLRLALAHVVTASCERANKLVYSAFSGLPTGLRDDDTTSQDGLGIVVYGATAAAAEVRLLAQPATLELPTSSVAEGIEDRVIPTTISARRLAEMTRLARYVAAVELYLAAQAVDLRERSSELGQGTRRVYDRVREHAPRWRAGSLPLADLSPLEQAMSDSSWEAPAG